MLSVVIPVHNSLPTLKTTIQSVLDNTKRLKELIIVDDFSNGVTKDWIGNLNLDHTLGITLIKASLPKHSWTNKAWNTGVALASQPYIAVLNSDITLSKDWDIPLIDALYGYTIACPSLPDCSIAPFMKEIDPRMIQGCAFMFEKEDRDILFPIPEEFVHWHGDRLLADRANAMNGVCISSLAIVTHEPSSSAKLLKPFEYYKTVLEDCYAYEKMTGKDESIVKDIIWENIKNLT